MFIYVAKKNINTSLIESFDEVGVCLVSGTIITITMEDYKILTDKLLPKERKAIKKLDIDLSSLFDELHQLTGGKGKATLTPVREKKLKELITKHKMTPELLKKAATNIGKNDFLQGANDSNTRYGNIDYLLRPDKAAHWSEVEAKKKGMFQ